MVFGCRCSFVLGEQSNSSALFVSVKKVFYLCSHKTHIIIIEMGKVLIIGAGGVATVAAHKVAQNTDVFSEIMIASRTKSKCDAIVKAIGRPDIKTAQVDADSVEQLCALFNEFKPDLVMNLALPYQDLTIMEACLQCGCSYLDTANYEPIDEAHFEYS